MLIHPKARALISKLSIPSPIQKFFSQAEWEIDLSNNTNPYMGWLAEYPDVKQENLKNIYLNIILSLNIPLPFKKENTPILTSENILFTVGSMEGLDLLLRTFAEPKNDVICVIGPTFPAYEHWGLLHSLHVKTLPFCGEGLNQIEIEKIIKLNPKLVFLCNPNNPTGTSIDREVIQKLCESLEGFIVVDEAYIEFSDQSSSIFHLHKHKNLIVLRTFSKAWGMAGIRCGSIIADKLIINTLRYVQLPFGFSSLSQIKIRKRLLDPEKTYESWKKIKINRRIFIEELLNNKGIIKIFKSEANFIMPVFKNFYKVMDLLKESKIQVLDCSASIPHSLRVSVGTKGQNKKFINVIRKLSAFE